VTFFERLVGETSQAHQAFMSIPILHQAVQQGIHRALYLQYLEQAYHHVRHTCPLLSAAASRCGKIDGAYQAALYEYINEEKGHDEWILNDIRALGGNRDTVRQNDGDSPVRIMVAYGYYAIDRINPYTLLGMVHVLEGTSVVLATQAAASIQKSVGVVENGGGFSYLVSHGSLDQEHVRFFTRLVNQITDTEIQNSIIDTANIMYKLFGDVFRALESKQESDRDAA
jgi:pyrroloquinoline quinone (PQQ) biosynthesis protein C